MKANFAIMGLPASGKTTFLAALWHLIEAGETECRLLLDGYRGELKYLNQISEAWRSFQKVPRTSHTGDVDVTINLLDRDTGAKGAAFFPDLAGETFDQQVEERRCKPKFIDELSVDDGILFFINANMKGEALSIAELNAALPVDGDAKIDYDEGNETSVNLTREWEPKQLPAQVRVVQLLSDLVRPPFTARTRRLAIMISAWDLARCTNLTPCQWLAAHMPLVDQFLRSNGDYFIYQIYGVSAQGVDLGNTAGVDEASRLTPSMRIQVVGPEEQGNDLTAPLVWLMSAEK